MSLENAKWICGGECDAPLIEKKLILPMIQSAEIDVCVLGFFELYINGKKVSDEVLSPVCSQVDTTPGRDLLYPIQDTFSGCRVYFNRYSLTEYLHSGENRLQFYLGNGWYNQKDRVIEGNFAHGVPRMCFSLRIIYDDGRTEEIVSDDTLTWRPSFIVYNNIFYGEKQDFTKKEERNLPKPVDLCTRTDAPLVLQDCPPDRVIRTIVPRLVCQSGDKKIYDCGENITGWVRFAATRFTTRVRCTFAEEITPQGTLDYTSTGYEQTMKQLQQDEFILDGEERECRPHFTWHGFRYFPWRGRFVRFGWM